jgi:hypothetical protein
MIPSGSPSTTPLRERQWELLRAVTDRLTGTGEGAVLAWALPTVQFAGLATGLTALAASLGVFDTSVAGVGEYLDDQRREVAARRDRFMTLTPSVLATFAEGDVLAVPVKGAVLGGSAGGTVWPDPGTRPMSDIDVLVPARVRSQAGALLTRAGWTLHATDDHEDTFLAWGDGSVGRTDGESAAHNGRIELHPGWREFLHGYVADGFDIEEYASRRADGQYRLDDAAFAVHVIGHLASTVVRAEVRAVNLIDVWFLHQRGLDWDAMNDVHAGLDPRLIAPGLWLVDQVLPGVVPREILELELGRLPGAHALAGCPPHAVLRDPGPRSTTRWRLAHTRDRGERAAVLRQVARSARGRLSSGRPG